MRKIKVSKHKQIGIQKMAMKEIIKENLKKLHAHKKIWKPHGRTSSCWSFYFVNDNAKVD
jgi:hypothetical protein